MDDKRESSWPRWADLEIPDTDFDVAALPSAIDDKRRERRMSWNAVAHEVGRSRERRDVHPVNPSTITGLKNRRWGVEGDGVLRCFSGSAARLRVSWLGTQAPIIQNYNFRVSAATGFCGSMCHSFIPSWKRSDHRVV